jgi:tetratricopeptide (TPR) repeat protein
VFYLRANEVAREITQLPVARDLYLRCVAEDPGFAPAWAGLGRAHRLIGKYLEISELKTHQARAEEALRRALELSPELPLAHKLYAHVESEVGRAQDAMVRLLRLARQTRNDPELFAGLVHACRYCGLFDASLAAHREAQRLDPNLATGVVHTLWQLGEFERLLEQPGTDGRASRAFALRALGRQQDALEAWEHVAQAMSPPTPAVTEWVDDVRQFLTGSRAAVHKNLEGAFDPEEIFFVGTQAAHLGMAEATSILGRAVDAGYPAWDALVRHPWIAPIRDSPGFADVVRRAEVARGRALAAFREANGPALLGLED